jgi:hypothetical protein
MNIREDNPEPVNRPAAVEDIATKFRDQKSARELSRVRVMVRIRIRTGTYSSRMDWLCL